MPDQVCGHELDEALELVMKMKASSTVQVQPDSLRWVPLSSAFRPRTTPELCSLPLSLHLALKRISSGLEPPGAGEVNKWGFEEPSASQTESSGPAALRG